MKFWIPPQFKIDHTKKPVESIEIERQRTGCCVRGVNVPRNINFAWRSTQTHTQHSNIINPSCPAIIPMVDRIPCSSCHDLAAALKFEYIWINYYLHTPFSCMHSISLVYDGFVLPSTVSTNICPQRDFILIHLPTLEMGLKLSFTMNIFYLNTSKCVLRRDSNDFRRFSKSSAIRTNAICRKFLRNQSNSAIGASKPFGTSWAGVIDDGTETGTLTSHHYLSAGVNLIYFIDHSI